MFAVTRIRHVDTGEKDRYGKPIMTVVQSTHMAYGFAPVVTGDVKGVESVVSEAGGTLYFRPPNLTEAIPDDRFVVRGVEYEVDGASAYWEHTDGVPKGSVVILKRTEYTRG